MENGWQLGRVGAHQEGATRGDAGDPWANRLCGAALSHDGLSVGHATIVC